MERAKDYRRRAEQLRAIAEDCKDIEAQETLLEMAREYERMAEERERELRAPNTKKTPNKDGEGGKSGN